MPRPVSPVAGKTTDRRAVCGRTARTVRREGGPGNRFSLPLSLLHPGDLLADGRFELHETAGEGGFATVWKTWDHDANDGGERLVALKVLHGHHGKDLSRRERFFRGARQMAKLQHENVVAVLEEEHEDDGWFFFVMEYISGGNFEQAIRKGRLTRSEQLTVLQQVGNALAFAHGRGVVHRDVKPANILLDGSGVAKLADFDLVRADDTTGYTATRAMLGTLQFAAPEALESAADAGVRADVYSLASTVVFVFLDGKLPARYYRGPEKVIDELPQVTLRPVLTRATAFEADERFASVEAFCEALADSWSKPVSQTPEEQVAAANRAGQPLRVRRHKTSRWLLFTLVVTLVVGAWSKKEYLWSGQETLLPSTPDPAPAESDEVEGPTAGPVYEGPLGIRFRFIPKGTYQMGSPTDEHGRADREILHEVELTSGFWMGETEVTQGQWQALTGNNPSGFNTCGSDCPVEKVRWYDTVAFANRLSEAAELEPCYELDCTGTPGEEGHTCSQAKLIDLRCDGYRLPTEAEWERAVRAGSQEALYSGPITIKHNQSPELDPIAWYGGNSGSTTHPVRQKKANDWGLFDMLGNVFEWCGDAYAPYPTKAQSNPFVAKGSGRVFRGGGWIMVRRACVPRTVAGLTWAAASTTLASALPEVS